MGASKILVTVVDPKSGVLAPGLKAEDFSVLDDQTPRPVEAAEVSHATLDIMTLLDTSLVGEMVHPLAANLSRNSSPRSRWPHVLDALYAAIDGGFQSSAVRRVILLLTAGVEGYSRIARKTSSAWRARPAAPSSTRGT